MKQISKLDSQQLRSKRPVLLEFYSNQKLLYVIWVKLKSFSEDFFFFCERSVCEKVQLSKILKRRYFLLGSCIDTIFGLPWNKKNCFGSLINHGTILWTGITCKNILFFVIPFNMLLKYGAACQKQETEILVVTRLPTCRKSDS